MCKNILVSNQDEILINELSLLIEQSKKQVVVQANINLTILFWQVGHRINNEMLKNKRADYANKIVARALRQLELKYRRNFEKKNLRRMLQFA